VKYLILFFVFSLFSWSDQAWSLTKKRPRIVMIAPSSPKNSYWPSVYRVINSVGKDLNYHFEHVDVGVKDRFLQNDLAIKILEGPDRPDALIIVVAIGNTKPILEVAERYKIPVIIQGPLWPFETRTVGMPREKHKQYIALVQQEEVLKGYMSAKLLFNKAMNNKQLGKDGKIHMLAIGGQKRWVGSSQREEGMQKALREFPLIDLKQISPGTWDTADARVLTSKMLIRFPESSIIWAASDAMAEGAMQALEDKGKLASSGKYFVSGIDMSELGLRNVIAKRSVGTAAMSVLGMGEMMVYIYDYLMDKDFVNEIGTIIESETLLATSENANQLLELVNRVDKIDYKRFSKFYNPNLKHYDFKYRTLLNAAGINEDPL
jgi:ABC-type sugar transport system substrate-binding protein